MKKLQELEARSQAIRKQIWDIEHKELEKKVLPKAKKLIGKCFKYPNSYGNDQEPWWLYQKVIGISSVMDENKVLVKVNEFQKDCVGRIDFTAEDISFRDFGHYDKWTEISEKEYQEEKSKLIKILQNF